MNPPEYELALRNKGYTQHTDGSWSKVRRGEPGPALAGEIDSVAHDAKRQRNAENEPLAAAPRANPDQKRRLVRLTAIRRRLLDERNLFDKHFVDSLKDAGIIVDDSPRWAKVEISQKIGTFECTVIEVFDLD